MAQPERRLRADAARNRARLLDVAYDTFAAEGLSVPIDEIAGVPASVPVPSTGTSRERRRCFGP